MIVYKATNKLTNKSYIGQTIQDFSSRIKAHFSEARRSKFYFHQALIKYGGDNFDWEILERCNSKEELDELEFHYIKQFNTLRPGGYNLTLGGDGIIGYTFTDEDRRKMSAAKKGHKMTESAKKKMMANRSSKSGSNNPMFGVESPMKGKHHTQESKNKISNKLLGKKFSKEHKRKLSEAAKRRWRLRKNG